jgi:hypothetical protein
MTQQIPAVISALPQSGGLPAPTHWAHAEPLIPEAEHWTSDPDTDHGNLVQQFVYPLIVRHSLDTINISTPLPVEDLSAIPRVVTLNSLQKGTSDLQCLLVSTILQITPMMMPDRSRSVRHG